MWFFTLVQSAHRTLPRKIKTRHNNHMLAEPPSASFFEVQTVWRRPGDVERSPDLEQRPLTQPLGGLLAVFFADLDQHGLTAFQFAGYACCA